MTNSVRRMTDTDLTLYPQSKFSVRLGYSQNIMQGPSLLPVRSGGVLKYNALMEQYLRHSTDEYTHRSTGSRCRAPRSSTSSASTTTKRTATSLWTPTGSWCRKPTARRPTWATGMLSSNGSATATTLFAPYSTAACNSNSIANSNTFLYPSQNGGKPIIDPSCAVVTSYQRDISDPHHHAERDPALPVDQHQEPEHERPVQLQPDDDEHAQLLRDSLGPERHHPQRVLHGGGTGKREVYSAQYGVIWQVAKNFDLEDQVTLSANGQPGTMNTSGYTKLVTGTAAGQETINYTGTLTSSVTNSGVATGEVYGVVYTYFGNEQLVNNLTATWTVTPKANFAFTYRYGNRNIGLNLNVTPTTPAPSLPSPSRAES